MFTKSESREPLIKGLTISPNFYLPMLLTKVTCIKIKDKPKIKFVFLTTNSIVEWTKVMVIKKFDTFGLR